MDAKARRLTVLDTLRLQWKVLSPAYLGGVIAPNRVFVPRLSRWDVARHSMDELARLREKYASEYLWTRFPFRRTLFVLGARGITSVLESSDNAADPPLKKRRMAQYVPHALTISSGDAWRARRRFNETVLASERRHRHAATFVRIAGEEVERLREARPSILLWRDFERLALRVSHQILFGPGQLEPTAARELARMIQRSNYAGFLWRHRFYRRLHGRLDRLISIHAERLDAPANASAAPTHGAEERSRCLVQEAAAEARAEGADVALGTSSQIAFWMFVLKDAIELHVARTLALIGAHRSIQDRLHEALDATGDAFGVETIESLGLLERCLEEQLRLWTPVPLLLRRVHAPFRIDGDVALERGRQIAMPVAFHHRDARVFGERAHRFRPDEAGEAARQVYFFSGGRQSCAGESLVRLALKAVLARVLATWRVTLNAPVLDVRAIPCQYNHFAVSLGLEERR